MEYNLRFEDKNLNIKHTLDCGQCFRWKCTFSDDFKRIYEYIGVIDDRVLKIRQEKACFFVSSNNNVNLKQKIYEYFDLEYNYEETEKNIMKIDNNIKSALKFSSGIHILNQGIFETVISYIISANNNIKRISNSVEQISRLFGEKTTFNNNEYFLFPNIEQLIKASNEDLIKCGVGYRAKYITATIKMLNENKNNILRTHTELNNEDIKKELMKYIGIGNKVADCIMLFSMKRKDIFPIDVWVKKTMEELYFNKDTSIKAISLYAIKNFGKYSGIIQQHLFYNIRNKKINDKKYICDIIIKGGKEYGNKQEK